MARDFVSYSTHMLKGFLTRDDTCWRAVPKLGKAMRRLSSTLASTLLAALMGTVSACASQDRNKSPAAQAAPADESRNAAIDMSPPTNLEDAIHGAQSLRA